MDWFSFSLNSITLAGQGILHLFFVCRFTGRPFRARMALYLVCLFFIEAAALLPQVLGENFASDSTWPEILSLSAAQSWISAAAMAAAVAVLFAFCRFALKISPALSFISAILAHYISQLSFGIINSLESLLFPEFVGGRLLYMLVVLASLAALALCAGCYLLILRWFSLETGQEQPHILLLLPSCFFFFAAERFILYAAYGQPVSLPAALASGSHLILLALQALGLAALLSTLLAYRRICRGFRAQAAVASMTRELALQKTYISQAQTRYERTRSFRHDINNHLSVLDGLLKEGRAEQAKAYLQKLAAAASRLSFPVQTGNPVVDTVLGDKLELARAEGIQTEVSLSLPKDCRTDDLDLCVIFANALDNALRACREFHARQKKTACEKASAPCKQAFLHITGCRQGDFYMLEFENTCLPGPSPAMGTGLSNIKAVAEKYSGAMTAERSGQSFRLSVLLNISRHPEPPSVQIY